MMAADLKERAAVLVASWRTSADGDNPAGPLYASGVYAEADMVVAGWPESGRCGTACTYSRTRQCC
jgi:Family of unknown function (DUF6229)